MKLFVVKCGYEVFMRLNSILPLTFIKSNRSATMQLSQTYFIGYLESREVDKA